MSNYKRWNSLFLVWVSDRSRLQGASANPDEGIPELQKSSSPGNT
ncbi:hypothetical protein [Coleofasciculus sp. FACHB-1120]|nr:hypothetical protein [Coleofasciculus sp. FACHB-1120]